jgi:hypothetical protein
MIKPKLKSASKGHASKVKGKEMGLQIGRYTDLLFRKVVDKEISLNPSDFKHRRCKYTFDALKAQNVLVTKTQVRVKHESLQVQTLLDGLGITKSGHPCVIELKTTQYTISEHEIRYNQQCRLKPKLTNGLPNSEFVLHTLQAAFGALALRETYTDCQKNIQAVVIVAASDGAKAYWVDNRFISISMFTGSKTLSSQSHPRDLISSVTRTDKIKFISWPKNSTMKSIEDSFKQRGYTQTEANSKPSLYCSGIAYAGDKTAPTSIAVIGITHYPSNVRIDVNKQAIHKRQLKADATKIYKRFKGKCNVFTFIASPNASLGSFDIIKSSRPMTAKKVW